MYQAVWNHYGRGLYYTNFLQESESGEFGQRWRDRASEIIVVKVEAYETLESSKLSRDCSPQVVHV